MESDPLHGDLDHTEDVFKAVCGRLELKGAGAHMSGFTFGSLVEITSVCYVEPTQVWQHRIVSFCKIHTFNNVEVPAMPAKSTNSADSPSEDRKRIILMCCFPNLRGIKVPDRASDKRIVAIPIQDTRIYAF